jgi:hypothetical protein
MIAAGSSLTFTVRGTTEASQWQVVFTPGMLRSGVVDVLSRVLDVVRVDVSSDDTIITGTLPWTYRADVQVRTRAAYAQSNDVAAIVANAFAQAGGNVPTVSAGYDLEFTPPELSWKVVIAIGAVAVLVIAFKVA